MPRRACRGMDAIGTASSCSWTNRGSTRCFASRCVSRTRSRRAWLARLRRGLSNMRASWGMAATLPLAGHTRQVTEPEGDRLCPGEAPLEPRQLPREVFPRFVVGCEARQRLEEVPAQQPLVGEILLQASVDLREDLRRPGVPAVAGELDRALVHAEECPLRRGEAPWLGDEPIWEEAAGVVGGIHRARADATHDASDEQGGGGERF